MMLSYAQYWAGLPEKAKHPRRIPILEVLWWVGEPLSAIDLVNLFDGDGITMWEAERDLRALARLGVVEPDPGSGDAHEPSDAFHLPYRLALGEARG